MHQKNRVDLRTYKQLTTRSFSHMTLHYEETRDQFSDHFHTFFELPYICHSINIKIIYEY